MGVLADIARRAAGGSRVPALDLVRASAGVDRRASLAEPSQAMREAWGGSGTVAGGATVTPQTALTHGDVYACIRALSDAAGSLPLIVYRRLEDGGRERADGTPQARLLRRPHPLLTQSGLISLVVAHLNGWGNAYLGKIWDGGRIARLWPIHPSRVTVEVKGGDPVYTVTAAGEDTQEGVYKARDILHIKALSDDGIIGLSPIAQARQVLGLGMTMAEYAGRFFANSAYPGGIIRVQKELSPAAAQRLKESWDRFHRGMRNSFRVAVLEEGADFQTVSVSPQDSQFVEQRRLSTTEIARIFRVPPWMIAADAGSSMTYSNVEQQMIQFAEYSLRPWLVTIEQALAADRDIFPDDGSIFPEFLMDALLRADTATRSQAYSAAHGRWMTTNEIRRRENLPPIEGGDELAPAAPPAPASPADDGGT